MNIRQCAILLAIHETRSITKAAALLQLSQPTASFHMKNLEKEMNQSLFLMKNGETHLTEHGLALLDYARKILALSKDAYALMTGYDSNGNRPLAISACPFSAEHLLIPTLQAFVQQHPQIPIALDVLPAHQVENKVIQFQADFGILYSYQTAFHPDLQHIHLLNTEILLVYSQENHFIRNSDSVSKILSNEKLLLHTASPSFQEAIQIWAKQNQISFHLFFQSTSLALIKAQLLNHCGVSILPKSVVINELKAGLLKAKPFPLQAQLYLITNKDRILLPSVKAFVAMMQSNCK